MSEERGPRGLEWVLLAVVAIMAAFAVLVTGGIRAVDFALIEYIMVGALALSVLRIWLHKKPMFHVTPVLWSALAFTGYVAIRSYSATVPLLAEDELTRVLFYLAFLVILTFHLFRPQYGQTMLVVLATVAIGASLYAAYQYFTGSNMVWHFYRPGLYGRRGSGTFINPNNFAGYVAVLLPMMVSMVVVGRVNVTTRCLAAYAAAMFVIGLAVAASRGALVAAVGGILALIFMLMRQKPFRIPALIMLSVVVLGGMGVLSQFSLSQLRFQEIDTGKLGMDARVLLWQSAEEMWRDHPMAGVGPGHYDAFFPQYRPDMLQQRKPYFAHNEYLNTLADYGLVGALLIMLAVVAAEFAFRFGWRSLQRDATNLEGARSNRLALLLGASSGVVVALLHALFDYNFHLPAYALLVLFFMGLIAVAWRGDNPRWWWHPKVAGKATITLISLALAVWFGMHATKRMKEAQQLELAKKAELDSPEWLEHMKKAAEIEPRNARTLYDIGEHYRSLSWLDKADYQEQGKLALEWYERAAKQDPLDSYMPLRQAMTYIWIKDEAAAKPYLAEAERLNPKDYFTLANLGWCQYELANYPEAVRLLSRSIQLRNYGNELAVKFLPMAREKLSEQPAGKESGQ